MYFHYFFKTLLYLYMKDFFNKTKKQAKKGNFIPKKASIT